MQSADALIHDWPPRNAGAHELVGVEVKAGATVTAADFRGLHRLRDAAGDRFMAGVVLYGGEACAGFGDRLFAVSIRALWETL